MDKYKKNDISLSTFNYLFSQMIIYLIERDAATAHDHLKRIGGEIGLRLFNSMIYKEKIVERESKIIPMLRFVQNNLFKYIFGKEADKLSVDSHGSIENKRVYIIKYLKIIQQRHLPDHLQVHP